MRRRMQDLSIPAIEKFLWLSPEVRFHGDSFILVSSFCSAYRHLHPARDNDILIALGKNTMSIVLCLEMTRIQQKHSSSEVRGHPLLEDDITISIATRIHHKTHRINYIRAPNQSAILFSLLEPHMSSFLFFYVFSFSPIDHA